MLAPWISLSLWPCPPSFQGQWLHGYPKICVLINGNAQSIIKTSCIPLVGYWLFYFKDIFSSFLTLNSSSFNSFQEYLRFTNSTSGTLSSVSCIHFTFLKVEIPWPINFMTAFYILFNSISLFTLWCSRDRVTLVK